MSQVEHHILVTRSATNVPVVFPQQLPDTHIVRDFVVSDVGTALFDLGYEAMAEGFCEEAGPLKDLSSIMKMAAELVRVEFSKVKPVNVEKCAIITGAKTVGKIQNKFDASDRKYWITMTGKADEFLDYLGFEKHRTSLYNGLTILAGFKFGYLCLNQKEDAIEFMTNDEHFKQAAYWMLTTALKSKTLYIDGGQAKQIRFTPNLNPFNPRNEEYRIGDARLFAYTGLVPPIDVGEKPDDWIASTALTQHILNGEGWLSGFCHFVEVNKMVANSTPW